MSKCSAIQIHLARIKHVSFSHEKSDAFPTSAELSNANTKRCHLQCSVKRQVIHKPRQTAFGAKQMSDFCLAGAQFSEHLFCASYLKSIAHVQTSSDHTWQKRPPGVKYFCCEVRGLQRFGLQETSLARYMQEYLPFCFECSYSFTRWTMKSKRKSCRINFNKKTI